MARANAVEVAWREELRREGGGTRGNVTRRDVRRGEARC
ncbi:Hypothetical protein CAP_4906 [Chondromyces apiculatus DSM 436]|uniref:Uncharacterized protein n=1 Tax=Chondromyces apiculatus DSM 436 TaxID=1192034 RepID=A0A017T4X6_9BACT|nr:Hypothetical protein CAP_4906 [Chondromyces apiculatus DSM 436]